MSFLKILQKHETERPQGEDMIAEKPAQQSPVEANEPAGILSLPELRIGAPGRPLDAESDESEPKVEARPARAGKPESLIPVDASTFSTMPAVPEIFVNIERVNPRVVSITQPRSPYCEEYRNLRTQVLHRSKKRKLQAIVVASVGPSEGKSVTALNLSWLFAQTDGVRALVIDSDLRRPSLADYLGIEVIKGGLSDVLAGAPLMSSIVRLNPSGLYLLPGGSARSDVAELISGPRFAEILAEARKHFDYIIIDAPPLGIFTDASLLINLADGAMLVVRANHTKYKDVDRILDTLPRERMLGTVLNQSDVPLMDESYYRYGYYGRNEQVSVPSAS